ncbi:beta-ketoacyl synthase N-terminal-like domain-containing protein, partial [Nocardia sp. NPDC050630]|uniref:beta-ketoacyl synthase N-terminal-like domain-containing protein n=1 Tax=Nocardia sp. NPDC050630 TaxID=3364321 RepID=UPI0037B3123B
MSTSPTNRKGQPASVRPYPPVSIVGIGCRVPGASSVPEFWRMLCDGRDATGAPPPGRPGTRHAGYLADADAFDNDWFAISAREAALMDPQQRLALEVAIEALDDAGIGYRTRGCGAAVVFGACAYDHGIAVLGRAGHDAPYAVTGSALSIIANRLSYVLDLHGPSLVVDSACSSSLAAVDFAVRLLADDAVPFAIVGGVNLTVLPHTSEYLAEAGFLAPDGQCKPFDAAADGYTRSDGCAVVVLRRTDDALRDGHRVYAEILGTAVGSDGRSNGLYAPNGRAQQEVIRTAWAGLDPRAVGYVECHGTGTPLGDAVEVGALAAVLGSETEPTWIGSVKSNIGHLEAAAGITGMVKAALSIRHGVIPPTINFHTENPLLKLAEHGLRVPTESVDWTDTSVDARFAGVSSFGFGGTNAHVVLRGLEAARHRSYEPPVLLPVTGRNIAELRSHALRWAELLENVGTSSSGDSRNSMSTVPSNRPSSAARGDMSTASHTKLNSAGHQGI